MTNDEKAKAYDMALEAARKELGVDRKEWEVVQRVLHNIFPELRESESEDERIRKELISFLRSPFIKENLTNEKVAPWLEWIEKQKEQVTDESDKVAATYQLGRSDERKQKEQKPVEWSEEDESCWNLIWDILDGPFTASKEGCKKAAAWFLKNCPKGTKSLRPSWKPSEVHLSALLAIFNDPNNIDSQTCQLALTDLYEQLKKL